MLDNIWTWADIVSLSAGFILFLMTVWIGKNQERSVYLIRDLTKEIKYLQTGLSGLEIYEKIGVIEKGIHRVELGEASAAPALLYDCLSLLPVLQFCEKDLAIYYAESLLPKSLELLTNYDSYEGKPLAGVLVKRLLKQIKKLDFMNNKKNNKNRRFVPDFRSKIDDLILLFQPKNNPDSENESLIRSMESLTVTYLYELKSKNPQRAKEIYDQFLEENGVMKLLSLNKQNNYTIIELLNSSNRKD
ncbi:MAG: hypothetical protein RSE13_23290 [Planktothrix sp. GU0601_MAG3]|nr:MAG: hypothetical protein RSE13_23290 [Planktothrix sp. GU0601_MAG3]